MSCALNRSTTTIIIKLQELDEKIDLIHNEIENLMQKWEEYSEKVEN